MHDKPELNVVLMWHMHQPQYQNLISGEYSLPWTYLHAVKDYSDMAAHLEANPVARTVVNFSPVLLEQLNDYSDQLQAYLRSGSALSDPWLALLANPQWPSEEKSRRTTAEMFLHAHEQNMIQRFAPYAKLVRLLEDMDTEDRGLIYLDAQFLTDLVVWFHLSWVGEHPRRSDLRIKRLTEKEREYSSVDCRVLLEVIAELVSGVIPRYRALAASGQIELAMNPYAHPIIPLLQNFDTAREAMPDIQLPMAKEYPGGRQRAQWHVQEGLRVFEHYFGFRPAGCWPSEGAVSEEAVRLFEKSGFRWIATGENVLSNSFQDDTMEHASNKHCHHAYYLRDGETALFFRNDGLSDLIGFTYSDWHADDAVNNLVQHLEVIAEQAKPGDVVSIILDGENAWEHYAFNGYYFLNGLYEKLSAHPKLHLTTFNDYLADRHAGVKVLDKLVAGSWVYGTFSTWIGMRDKNRAWDMLVDAKRCFDEKIKTANFSSDRMRKLELQLARCESSDWFWWFGDYNASDSVQSFERLYRQNLASLYELLEQTPPDYLASSFTFGSEAEHAGGSMRPGNER